LVSKVEIHSKIKKMSLSEQIEELLQTKEEIALGLDQNLEAP
jgi:hypothetical protein